MASTWAEPGTAGRGLNDEDGICNGRALIEADTSIAPNMSRSNLNNEAVTLIHSAPTARLMHRSE